MIERWESEIKCEWVLVEGKAEGNEACDRIERLIHDYLVEVSHDRSGWERLYVDPTDGRFWELTYPHSEMHGGGPPLLRVIGESRARETYGEAVTAWPR